jgi:hypothetical protein
MSRHSSAIRARAAARKSADVQHHAEPRRRSLIGSRRSPHRPARKAKNDQFGAARTAGMTIEVAVHNGRVSARLSRVLASFGCMAVLVTARRQVGQAVYLYIAVPRGTIRFCRRPRPSTGRAGGKAWRCLRNGGQDQEDVCPRLGGRVGAAPAWLHSLATSAMEPGLPAVSLTCNGWESRRD